jgi:hypothetical protein
MPWTEMPRSATDRNLPCSMAPLTVTGLHISIVAKVRFEVRLLCHDGHRLCYVFAV